MKSFRNLIVIFISGFIIRAFFSIAGYFYLDFHVLTVSTYKFVKTGLTPYEWKEPWIQWWFAYPPLHFLIPAFFLYLFHCPNWIAMRFLIKLPAIIGDLILIWLGYRVADVKGALFFAFNPYFIYISALRGHYDSLVSGLIALSIMEMKSGKSIRAGIIMGLASTIKQSAFLFGFPIVAMGKNTRSRISYLMFFLTAPVLISLPFMYGNWNNFYYWVIKVHEKKIAWNYGFLGLVNIVSGLLPLVYHVSNAKITGSMSPAIYLPIISRIPLYIGLVIYYVWIIVVLYSRKKIDDTYVLDIIPLVLLLSPVVNIQYISYISIYEILHNRFDKLERRLYIFVLMAGLIDSCEILKSIPPLGFNPVNYWAPSICSGDLLTGITAFVSGLLYMIGISSYIKQTFKHLSYMTKTTIQYLKSLNKKSFYNENNL